MATFPTNTEITTLQSSTYTAGTNAATGYQVAQGEKPISSSKWQNFIIAVQQLITFVNTVLVARINQRVAAGQSAIQVIPNTTFTKITFGSPYFDNASLWNGSTPTRFTIPTGAGGYYRVSFKGTYTTNSTGFRLLAIGINGVAPATGYWQGVPAIVGTDHGINYMDIFLLNATDYIECYTYQSCGGNLNLNDSKVMIERVNI